MTIDRWELRGDPSALAPTWRAILIVLAAGLGLAGMAVAVAELRWLAAFAILLLFGTVAGIAARRRYPPDRLLLLAADSEGIEVPPIGHIGWERVMSIDYVDYRGLPFLRIAVRSPYQLVKMRSKRLRSSGHAVVAFNGQPLNIDPDRVPIPLEDVRRVLLEHAPSRLRDTWP